MGFRKIFRGKRQSSESLRSHKKNRDKYDTHEGDDNSFTGSDVSSLGNSIYSDTNGITSSRQRQLQRRIYKPHAVLETVLTEEESNHRKNSITAAAGSDANADADAIYMFPKTWQERTGSSCRGAEAATIEEDSIARRRRIFEQDMDADLAWDTTLSIDESRYTYRNHGHPLASWMACLACV